MSSEEQESPTKSTRGLRQLATIAGVLDEMTGRSSADGTSSEPKTPKRRTSPRKSPPSKTPKGGKGGSGTTPKSTSAGAGVGSARKGRAPSLPTRNRATRDHESDKTERPPEQQGDEAETDEEDEEQTTLPNLPAGTSPHQPPPLPSPMMAHMHTSNSPYNPALASNSFGGHTATTPQQTMPVQSPHGHLPPHQHHHQQQQQQQTVRGCTPPVEQQWQMMEAERSRLEGKSAKRVGRPVGSGRGSLREMQEMSMHHHHQQQQHQQQQHQQQQRMMGSPAGPGMGMGMGPGPMGPGMGGPGMGGMGPGGPTNNMNNHMGMGMNMGPNHGMGMGGPMGMNRPHPNGMGMGGPGGSSMGMPPPPPQHHPNQMSMPQMSPSSPVQARMNEERMNRLHHHAGGGAGGGPPPGGGGPMMMGGGGPGPGPSGMGMGMGGGHPGMNMMGRGAAAAGGGGGGGGPPPGMMNGMMGPPPPNGMGRGMGPGMPGIHGMGGPGMGGGPGMMNGMGGPGPGPGGPGGMMGPGGMRGPGGPGPGGMMGGPGMSPPPPQQQLPVGVLTYGVQAALGGHPSETVLAAEQRQQQDSMRRSIAQKKAKRRKTYGSAAKNKKSTTPADGDGDETNMDDGKTSKATTAAADSGPDQDPTNPTMPALPPMVPMASPLKVSTGAGAGAGAGADDPAIVTAESSDSPTQRELLLMQQADDDADARALKLAEENYERAKLDPEEQMKRCAEQAKALMAKDHEMARVKQDEEDDEYEEREKERIKAQKKYNKKQREEARKLKRKAEEMQAEAEAAASAVGEKEDSSRPASPSVEAMSRNLADRAAAAAAIAEAKAAEVANLPRPGSWLCDNNDCGQLNKAKNVRCPKCFAWKNGRVPGKGANKRNRRTGPGRPGGGAVGKVSTSPDKLPNAPMNAANLGRPLKPEEMTQAMLSANRRDDGRFGCITPGCTRSFKSPHGVRYHLINTCKLRAFQDEVKKAKAAGGGMLPPGAAGFGFGGPLPGMGGFPGAGGMPGMSTPAMQGSMGPLGGGMMPPMGGGAPPLGGFGGPLGQPFGGPLGGPMGPQSGFMGPPLPLGGSHRPPMLSPNNLATAKTTNTEVTITMPSMLFGPGTGRNEPPISIKVSLDSCFDNKTRRFKCPIRDCWHRTENVRSLRQHIDAAHGGPPGEDDFKCPTPGCSESFSTESTLRDHFDVCPFRVDRPSPAHAMQQQQPQHFFPPNGPENPTPGAGMNRTDILAATAAAISEKDSESIVLENIRDKEDWTEQYSALKIYRAKHGNINVPVDRFPSLAQWVKTQNDRLSRLKALKMLTDGGENVDDMLDSELELVASRLWVLDELGFNISSLKDISELPSHSHPIHAFPPGSARQNRRGRGRTSKGGGAAISHAPIKEPPFKKPSWEDMYSQLQEYKNRKGHCNVDVKNVIGPEGFYDPDFHLTLWAEKQRQAYKDYVPGTASSKDSELTDARVDLLDDLDFDWTASSDRKAEGSAASDSEDDGDAAKNSAGRPKSKDANHKWNSQFNQLLEYVEQYGDCKVPRNWVGDRKLSRWVDSQRSHFHMRNTGRYTSLTDDRKKALESIGFNWYASEWEDLFRELKKFNAEFGHCNVPKNWKRNPVLAAWTETQRSVYTAYLSGSTEKIGMTREKEQRLTEIGFNWNFDPDAEDSADSEEEPIITVEELRERPAPSILELVYLPEVLPNFHRGPGTKVEKLIEQFEVKIIDEDEMKVYPPLRLLSNQIRKRLNTTTKFNLVYGNRLRAYYAAMSGNFSPEELAYATTTELKNKGRELGRDLKITDFFNECCRLHEEGTSEELVQAIRAARPIAPTKEPSPNRRPGRPKGSKNKKGTIEKPEGSSGRGRGRPKGSKDRKPRASPARKKGSKNKTSEPPTYDSDDTEDQSSSESEEETPELTSTVRVGSRIAIYWKDDDEWYTARVTGIANGKGTGAGVGYSLLYEMDGQKETLDLSKERFRIIGDSESGEHDSDQNDDSSDDDLQRETDGETMQMESI